MPRGPMCEKRPADVVGCAVRVAKIATGEVEDDVQEQSGRVKSGRSGAEAQKHALSIEERIAIAKRAATAR